VKTIQLVAQIFNLLYRRFSTCRADKRVGGLPIINRRYGRLKICATIGWARFPGAVAVLVAAILGPQLFAQQPATNSPAVRFQAVDIYVDSKDAPLAVYQLEFSVTNGVAKIVGIEGGEHPAFAEPPFYDPKAMQHERVILAAFSTEPADKLPVGKTRVATIHLQTGGPTPVQFETRLQTAADSKGNQISGDVAVEERKAP
jgi:hypothetical protein